MRTTIRGRPLCISCGFFLLVLFLLLTAWPIDCYDTGEFEGKTLVFTGRVDTVRCPGEKQQIFISKVALSSDNFSKIKMNKVPTGLICYVQQDALRPYIGERICVRGKLAGFSRATNPGQFDQGRYYQIRGYDALLYNASILSEDKKYGLKEYLFRIRTVWERVYDTCMDDTDAGMLKAMVLGDKDDLDAGWKALYQRSGQAHLLAISALHMSVISGVVYELLKRLLKNRWVSGILTMVFVILYGEMTQMSSSTQRAVIMFCLYMLSQLLGRCYDLMTSMAVAAVFSLICNPMLIYDAGFLLSYFAVMGVTLGLPMLQPLRRYLADRGGFYKRIGQLKIVDGVCASLVVSLFTFPLTLYYFYQFPPYSPLLNLIMIPLMGALLTLALLTGVLGIFIFALSMRETFLWQIVRFIGFLCHSILSLFEKLCKLPEDFYSFSNHKSVAPSVILGQPKLWKIAMYYGTLFFLLGVYYGRNFIGRNLIGKKRFRGMLATAVVLFLGAVVLASNNRPNRLAITVLDVGQGDCILIQNGGVDILVDGGSSDEKNVGEYRILPCLKALGVSKLDMILVTHTDADHVNGIEELIGYVGEGGPEIRAIGMTGNSLHGEKGEKIIRLAGDKKISICQIGRGDCLKNGALKLNVLYPEKEDRGEPNELSMVCRLVYGDFSMLLTGDVEGDGEIRLLKLLKDTDKCTIYKAAHHGSRGTGNLPLLHRISPSVSVVSCGTGYGHPHKEAISRMEEVGSRIFVTKECGAVFIETNGSKVKINAYRQ